MAEEKLHGLADRVFYAPIDYAFAVRRVLRRIRPSVVVILETEIWPVLYREAKRAGASSGDRERPYLQPRLSTISPLASLVPAGAGNGRMPSLRRASRIGSATSASARRPKRVTVLGNLKYDAAPPTSDPPQPVRDVMEQLQPTTVWIAASTMPGADSADVDEDRSGASMPFSNWRRRTRACCLS